MQYYGGSGNEVVRAIVASADGTMWVVGCTDSKDLEVTSEASQTSHGGSWDGFVARVS